MRAKVIFLLLFCFNVCVAQEKAQIRHYLTLLDNFSKAQSLDNLAHLQNPFLHNVAKNPLKLQAIVNGKALINGEWLEKGTMIQGYRFLEIYPQYVEIQKGKIIQHIVVGKDINE